MQKGAPRTGRLWLMGLSSLRQVIAEAGPEHVLDTLGRNVARGEKLVVPDEALRVAVLDTLTKAAFRSLVKVVPVADGAFLNVAGLAGAAGVRGGEGGCGGQRLCAAAGEGFAKAVAFDFAGAGGGEGLVNVVAAVVGVDVQTRRGVQFKCAEGREGM